MTSYENSSEQENSPLGWEGVLRSIKRAGDSQFKKHAKRFYSFEGFGETKLPFAGVIIGLLLLFLVLKKK